MRRFSNIKTAGHSAAGGRLEPLKGRTELSIGVDIGSVSSDLVALDADNRIIFHDYTGGHIFTFRQIFGDFS